MQKRFGHVLFILMLPIISYAQSATPKIVLEVHETGGGMVAIQGKYLKLRLLRDGTVEYEEPVIENGRRILLTREYRLGASQLKEFDSFINRPGFELVQNKYGPDAPAIDHMINIDISIRRGSEVQTISLSNFSPTLASARGKYPDELLELLCRIKSLRAQKDFRMLGDDCILLRIKN